MIMIFVYRILVLIFKFQSYDKNNPFVYQIFFLKYSEQNGCAGLMNILFKRLQIEYIKTEENTLKVSYLCTSLLNVK